jgi:hypothetical protein
MAKIHHGKVGMGFVIASCGNQGLVDVKVMTVAEWDALKTK